MANWQRAGRKGSQPPRPLHERLESARHRSDSQASAAAGQADIGGIIEYLSQFDPELQDLKVGSETNG